MESGEVDRIVKEKKTTTVTETREIVYFTHRLPSSIAISTRVSAFSFFFCYSGKIGFGYCNRFIFSYRQLVFRYKIRIVGLLLLRGHCKRYLSID